MFWKKAKASEQEDSLIYMYGKIGRDCSTLFDLRSYRSSIEGLEVYLTQYIECADPREKVAWLIEAHGLIKKNLSLFYFDTPYDIRQNGADFWTIDLLPSFKIPASRITFSVHEDNVTLHELIFNFDPIYSPVCPARFLSKYRIDRDDCVGFRNAVLDILKIRCKNRQFGQFFSKGLDYLYV